MDSFINISEGHFAFLFRCVRNFYFQKTIVIELNATFSTRHLSLPILSSTSVENQFSINPFPSQRPPRFA